MRCNDYGVWRRQGVEVKLHGKDGIILPLPLTKSRSATRQISALCSNTRRKGEYFEKGIFPPKSHNPLIDRYKSPINHPTSKHSTHTLRVALGLKIPRTCTTACCHNQGHSTSEGLERSSAFNRSFFCIHGSLSRRFEKRNKHPHTSRHIGSMAPDLNSLPPSPYSPRHTSSTSSRRAGDNMPPPPAPITNSPTIVSREPFANMTSGDNTGVGIGPGMRADTLHIPLQLVIQLTQFFLGPLRHPRPLTAADLHMQLEKEQEAVVS